MGRTNDYTVVELGALRREVRFIARRRLPDGRPLLSFDGNCRWTANYAYRCERPILRAKIGRREFHRRETTAKPLVLNQYLRCRKCDGCIVHNKNSWAMRARDEFYSSVRTWMATFTMSPVEHALLDAAAYRRWTGDVPPNASELLGLRTQVFGHRLAQWVQSVSRRAPAATRSYLLVAEKHDSARTSTEMRGRVHYHALFSEKKLHVLFEDTDCEWATERGRLVYRVKDDTRPRKLWPWGFSKFILVGDERGCSYATKYMDLALDARTKASRRYGRFEDAV